jgi:CoA:oxalate CoA-transferase
MSTGPLDGYRVIELGQGIPAPVAAMHLGDGGADVIKVEHRGGDVARGMPPFYAGGDSGVFVAVNRNKRGIELDLTSAAGQDVLRALFRTADVLIEDVDLTRELGLDTKGLIGSNPALVHTRISGYGPEGPMADLPGAEIAAQMAAEATTSLGSLTEPPVRPRQRRRQHLRGHLRRPGHARRPVATRGRRRRADRRCLALRRHVDDALNPLGRAV